jgi:GNAT superfamily N-acetyltransferase
MWNNNENNIENIVAEIGLYFIAFVNGEAGGIIKFQTEDDVFWPELKENNSAFIHRFAVRRKYSGGELSTEIINWAKRNAKLLGKTYLRLDCDAARPKLRKYYERKGFNFHSEKVAGPFLVAKYELNLRN